MLNMITCSMMLASLFLSSSKTQAGRPDPSERTFSSDAIDEVISFVKPFLKDPLIAEIWENCLPNTLDTTVKYYELGIDSFIITGDIEALWLRDSSNQVMAYIPYVSKDTNLALLIEGLIKRHASSVLIDPFANAFNYDSSEKSEHSEDIRQPPMSNAVFEGKYEIDSLASFLKLSYWYSRYSNSTSVFDANWLAAVQQAAKTIQNMQLERFSSEDPLYIFERYTSMATDTLVQDSFLSLSQRADTHQSFDPLCLFLRDDIL